MMASHPLEQTSACFHQHGDFVGLLLGSHAHKQGTNGRRTWARHIVVSCPFIVAVKGCNSTSNSQQAPLAMESVGSSSLGGAAVDNMLAVMSGHGPTMQAQSMMHVVTRLAGSGMTTLPQKSSRQSAQDSNVCAGGQPIITHSSGCIDHCFIWADFTPGLFIGYLGVQYDVHPLMFHLRCSSAMLILSPSVGFLICSTCILCRLTEQIAEMQAG